MEMSAVFKKKKKNDKVQPAIRPYDCTKSKVSTIQKINPPEE